VIKSGDPVEQEKQLKYAGLVANAIMLSNIADMTEALASMAEEHRWLTFGNPGNGILRPETLGYS
jgi:hypothetical protein